MNLLNYYASLRNEINDFLQGIEDAKSGLSWDNTKPNYSIRSRLERIYRRYLSDAQEYGLFVVTRHSNCPHHDDYVIENSYGLEIVYKDSNFHWHLAQLDQGTRHCKCPCSPNREPFEHHIIEDVLFARSADQEICAALMRILTDIHTAVEKSADKRTRSAIRENLLRALLEINDQILPVPMDEYVDRLLKLSADKGG